MKYLGKNQIITVLFGLAAVAPFFILEWSATSGFAQSGFPLALFLFMWADSTILIGTLLSALKDIRAQAVRSKILWFSLKVIILILSVWAWVYLIIDQMPCFLGASGC